VRRVLGAPSAVKVTQSGEFNLIVAVLPLNNAREFLSTLRAEDSQSRRAAVLVVLDENVDADRAKALTDQGNRVVPSTLSLEEVQKEAEILIRVAPRVAVKANARVRFGSPSAEQITLPVGNVSSTGVLLYSKDAPP